MIAVLVIPPWSFQRLSYCKIFELPCADLQLTRWGQEWWVSWTFWINYIYEKLILISIFRKLLSNWGSIDILSEDRSIRFTLIFSRYVHLSSYCVNFINWLAAYWEGWIHHKYLKRRLVKDFKPCVILNFCVGLTNPAGKRISIFINISSSHEKWTSSENNFPS
mgnify:FL=1